jgi:hypothetical protein
MGTYDCAKGNVKTDIRMFRIAPNGHSFFEMIQITKMEPTET